MKKNKIIVLFGIILVGFFCITSNRVSAQGTCATEDLQDLFDYSDYFNKDYSQYSNKTVYGKQYNVGVMGHRMSISYGDIKLKAEKIEDYVENRSVGSSINTTLETTKAFSITNELVASMQVKVGIEQMTSAAVEMKKIASVSTSTKITQEYTIGAESRYSEYLSEETRLQETLALENIPSDKKTYSYSKVAIFLEFNIKSSSTQEKYWWGWKSLSDTKKSDYVIRYYIFDVITFCYNDNTFGDTKMGIYNLSLEKIY